MPSLIAHYELRALYAWSRVPRWWSVAAGAGVLALAVSWVTPTMFLGQELYSRTVAAVLPALLMGVATVLSLAVAVGSERVIVGGTRRRWFAAFLVIAWNLIGAVLWQIELASQMDISEPMRSFMAMIREAIENPGTATQLSMPRMELDHIDFRAALVGTLLSLTVAGVLGVLLATDALARFGAAMSLVRSDWRGVLRDALKGASLAIPTVALMIAVTDDIWEIAADLRPLETAVLVVLVAAAGVGYVCLIAREEMRRAIRGHRGTSPLRLGAFPALAAARRGRVLAVADVTRRSCRRNVQDQFLLFGVLRIIAPAGLVVGIMALVLAVVLPVARLNSVTDVDFAPLTVLGARTPFAAAHLVMLGIVGAATTALVASGLSMTSAEPVHDRLRLARTVAASYRRAVTYGAWPSRPGDRWARFVEFVAENPVRLRHAQQCATARRVPRTPWQALACRLLGDDALPPVTCQWSPYTGEVWLVSGVLGEVELLAIEPDRARVGATLAGWWDVPLRDRTDVALREQFAGAHEAEVRTA